MPQPRKRKNPEVIAKAVNDAVGPHFPPDEWFTPREVADRLKVPYSQVRRWIYAGLLKSHVLPAGRGRRISGAALNEALTVAEPKKYVH